MFKALDISSIHDQLQTVLLTDHPNLQHAEECLHYLESAVAAYIVSIQTHTHQEVAAKNLPLFVHSQQFALIELLNLVTQPQPSHTAQKNTITTILEKIQQLFKRALDFINTFFRQYTNSELTLPLIDWHPTRLQLSERLTSIRNRLLSLQTSRLLTIALRPVVDAIDDDATPATYRMATYLHHLTDLLTQIPATGDINCHIRTVLGYVGFNSKPFLQYLTDSIEEEIAAMETTEEKINFLSRRAKDIKQIQILPHEKLYPQQIAASDYVIAFIAEETAYWQEYAQRQRLELSTGDEQPEQEKIHTEMPLSVLTAMLKVFVNANKTNPQPQEQILRIAARTFTTRKKKPIPFGSIRTEFFSNSLRAGQAAKEMFALLHNTAREIFR